MAPSYRRDGASDRANDPGERGAVEVFRSQRRGDAQPLWLAWLQLGISTMLVVLFLVVLGKVREQATIIGDLERKVRTIESARSQDRTTAMEQQLESMIQRLQSVEQVGDQVRRLDRQQQTFTQDLQQLRNTSRIGLEDQNPQPGRAQASPAQARPSSTPPGSPRPSATTLRPPMDNF